MSIKNKRRVFRGDGHAGDSSSFAFTGAKMSKKPKNKKLIPEEHFKFML